MSAGTNRIITPLIVVFILATTAPTFTGSINYVNTDARHSENHQDYVPEEIIIKFKDPTARTIGENTFADPDVAKLGLSDSLGKLNKKFRLSGVKRLFKNFKARKERTKALLKKGKALLTKKEKHILQRLKRAPEKATVPALDRIYKLQFDLEPDESIQDVLAAYNNDPSVEYAELNYIVSIDANPNDPLYAQQWSLNNTGQMYRGSGRYNHPPGTPDCDIDAPEAWDIYTGSSETIVAVVDTGVDYRHRDLDDNMWVNAGEIAGNGVDDDDNGYVDDIYGYDFRNNDSDPCDDRSHGTHCAGIIAAEGDNGLDVAGVCFNARIMALKFLSSSGRGYISDAVTAFYYAVENGADVISNSWGGGAYSYTLEQAIDYAHSQGVIMVASAGNDYSSSPKYPAYYNHIISVAATNSNDEKEAFSNYGDWVDIAAPGVDILSLRAENTSKGTTYDDYTTIMSGTSMACPHVAGACALLLSANPELTCDDVNDILMSTVDPIAPRVCKSGRLNLANAMLSIVSSQGYIILDNDYSSCDGTVGIFLADIDLRSNTTQQVILATSGGDSETVLLTKAPPAIGIFTGTIPTDSGNPNLEDNILQLSHGEIITAIYEDANGGTGNQATVTDTAIVDCQGPEIFNLQVDTVGPEPGIIFETDEETTARVLCGTVCGENYFIMGEDSTLSTLHTVILVGMVPETDYYFIVEATDRAGNLTVDDNGSACYMFTSDEGPRDVLVPDMYGTIQEAIDHSWPGGTVWVADGIYQGRGNRDLDFKKLAVTVRSVNGPQNCIMDCQGTEAEPHQGVYFNRGEDPNSRLIGFTIQNGYGLHNKGGGIFCRNSSPTIEDCIIRDCHAHYGGGMYNEQDSNPILRNCTFENNLAEGDGAISDGGGMYNHESHPTMINCSFIANRAFGEYDAEMFWTFSGGGGMYNHVSSPTLKNCSFIANAGISEDEGLGGGMYNFKDSSPYLEDCTFEDNVMGNGGGMCNWLNCSPVLIRCTFKRNIGVSYDEGEIGGGMYNREYSHPILEHCVFEENEGGGIENLESSHPMLQHCTFRNNCEGGIRNYFSDSVLLNCRFIGNYGGGGVNSGYSAPLMVNCTFQGNSSGDGGAVYNYWSSPELMNCVFTGNVAHIGGAINMRTNSNLVLVNCTFAENQAMQGRALFVDTSSWRNYPSLIRATNCIFWNGGDEIRYAGGDVTIDIQYSCVQDEEQNDGLIYPGIGNIDDDPLLLDADGADNISGTEDDIVLLLAGSPCLDAGDNMAVPQDQFDFDGDNDSNEPTPFDRAGSPRFVDDLEVMDTGNPGWGFPLVDMGAYEGSHNGFVLSIESIIVSEGATATFTVALWKEPNETVDVEITYASGDADITIVSGTHLTFDPSNYFQPQPVTLRAAEDEDYLIGTTLFRIEAEAIHPAGVTAIEGENEPVPEILYVDGSNSTLNTRYGRSWADALTSITEALQIASEYSAVEEIRVAQGVYTPTDPNGDRQVSFQLLSGVSLLGGYGGLTALNPNDRNWDEYPTILSGDLNGNDPIDLVLEDLLDDPRRADNSYNVVTFSEHDAATFLEGFVITGGNANRKDHNCQGGGMRNLQGNPTVKHCRFFANAALFSGGGILIYNYSYGNVVIDSCTFDNNFSGWFGGGIYTFGGRVTSIDCTFHRNSAHSRGGGIFFGNGSSTFENCTFRHNSADSGGGLYNNSYGYLTLNGCVFTGNTARYYAGGMYNDKNSKAILNHCIFSGNSAPVNGGGIYTQHSVDLMFNHCTFVANRAGRSAGGMYNGVCEPMLSNNIFWGNTDQDGTIESSQIYQAIYNPRINYCCVQGWTGTFGGMGNIDADPLFVDQGYWDSNSTPADANDDFWVEGDYHLLAGSPCIDAGDPNYIAEPNETDLDGNPRVLDGDDDGIPVIDMGPYEMVTKIEVTMRFTPQVLNCNSKGKWIKAHFILPASIRVQDVDDNISGRIDPLGIESDHMDVFADEDGLVRVEMAFDRTAFCDGLTEGASMEITVKGFLTNGHYFYGKDTIIIIDNIFEHLAFLSSQWLRADCSKPDWCQGADINRDSVVNLYDYAIIAEQWIQEQ